jgi:uncharacterized protein YlxP (DUF503 family)
MINKSMLMNKVIENVKNDYQLAVAQNDQTNIKKHQNNLVGLFTLKNQLEISGELNENNVPMHHTPPTPPQPNKGGNK